MSLFHGKCMRLNECLFLYETTKHFWKVVASFYKLMTISANRGCSASLLTFGIVWLF